MISWNSVLTKYAAPIFGQVSHQGVHRGYVNDVVGQTTTYFAQWDFHVIGRCWWFPCASGANHNCECVQVDLKPTHADFHARQGRYEINGR